MNIFLRKTLSEYKTVVVTGGSSGIGKSFILQLFSLSNDFQFCNLSRTKPDLNLPGLALTHYPCDLSDPKETADMAATLCAKLKNAPSSGKILFINNSGFGGYGRFPAPNLAHNVGMIDVNIRAAVMLAGSLLPVLFEKGGSIVNIASTAAFQPTPYLATYGASKAFLLHWSLALSEELRGTNVHCLAVCPGPTSTNFFRGAGFDEPALSGFPGQTPEQVVSTSLRALARKKTLCVCGWSNRIVASAASALPKTWINRLSGIILKKVRLEPRK